MRVEKDERGVEWAEESVTLQGCTFFYYHSLPANPLPKLMFLHGGGGNGPENVPLFSPLSDDFHIFLPSARGFGKSKQTPPQKTSTLGMVEDAAALIKYVSPSEPIFLIGHSMGGTVAPRVAKFYPELVKGLVLEDPAWLVKDGEPLPLEAPVMVFGGPPPGPRPRYPFQEEHEGLRRGGGLGGPGGRHGPGGPGGPDGKGCRGGPGGRDGGGPGGERRKGGGDEVSNQAVAGIPVPTLVLTGGPEAHCQRGVLAATLPTYELGREYNFPEAGHDIHSWYPEEWREQVPVWLCPHWQIHGRRRSRSCSMVHIDQLRTAVSLRVAGWTTFGFLVWMLFQVGSLTRHKFDIFVRSGWR